MEENILKLLKTLENQGIKLELNQGSLDLKSKSTHIPSDIIEEIRRHKEEVINYLKKFEGLVSSFKSLNFEIPENRIPADCTYIMPSMLPLVNLSQAQLDTIMDVIPGGGDNIQDIYPLAPLQEGIYYHHLMSNSKDGDPYILSAFLKFSTSSKREHFIEMLKKVIQRHDVLRTCVLSEGLVNPIQVVLREVSLTTTSIDLDRLKKNLPQEGVVTNPDGLWIDISKAPLLNLKVSDDPQNDAYYLATYYHHLITDHIGVEKIIEEIIEFSHGRQMQLPTPPLYRDFIAYVLHQQSDDSDKQYFSTLLSDIEESSYPFGLKDISAHGTTKISTHTQLLSSSLSNRILITAKKLQIRPSVFFHAAFGKVVSFCSNQDYALFGSLFLGRLQGNQSVDGSIGLLINTLPVYLTLHENTSDYISQTKTRLQDLQAFEQSSLTSIHDWSGIPNNMPLFSALLNYRFSNSYTDVDLDVEIIEGEELTNYPFTLDVDDYGDGFRLIARIADDQVTASRLVAYMIEALESLIDAVENNSNQSVVSTSILPKIEEDQILTLFNETNREYPLDKSVIDLFKEQLLKSPNSVALVFEGEEMTYAELDRYSNQLSNCLISKDIGLESLVGICIERGFEMIVGILGILKSGAAYVPILPSYPLERIRYILEEIETDIVLTDTKSYAKVSSQINKDWIVLNGKDAAIDGYSNMQTNVNITKTTLSYVIYTSGSTGKPKGAMIEHAGMLNHLLMMHDYFAMDEKSKVAFTAPFTFDISVWQLLSALLCGGQIVIYPEESIQDTNILLDSIASSRVTHLQLVPSYLSNLLEVNKVKKLSSLKYFLITGEAVTPVLVSKWFTAYPNIPMVNAYGPSEASDDVSFYFLYNPIDTVTIPIGKPAPNLKLYVVDNIGNLCSIGVTGELWVSGIGVGRGYLNDKEKTRKSFLESPFEKGERIYKTGDLAKWLPDGNLEFIGRKDDQVKIRGYRVELGEIESILSQLEEIHHCCVLAKEGPDGTKRLVGYVVVDGELDKQALKDALKKQLPDYMIPQLWVALAKLPLTRNGKIDKKGLPDPELSDLSSYGYIAPRNEIETQLVEIWQELLEIEKISILDNFFELGGHSLLIVRLISQLQNKGFDLKIKDIMSNPSIATLSSRLSLFCSTIPENGILKGATYITPSMVTLMDLSQEELDRIMAQVPGGGANIQDIYPLSPLQEGIYFHHLISNTLQNDPYILNGLLCFNAIKDRLAFIEALDFVIQRHDILRTCVLSKGLDAPVQVVQREVTLEVKNIVIDPTKEALSQMEAIISDEHLWLDISKAPLLVVTISDDTKNDAYYLGFNYHHLVMDHVGIEKVVEEISYYQSGKGHLLSQPVLYRNFIGDIIYNYSIEESELFFRSLFEGIKAPTYPFNLTDTMINRSSRIRFSEVTLPSELSASIRNICKVLQVSPAVIFHAAFGLVVGRCSNTDYAIFGSLFLGRLQGVKGSETSLGVFINTLPILLKFNGNVSQYIKQVSELLQEILPYEQTPISSIHQWSDIPNDMSMFSALLNYRHSNDSESTELSSEFEVLAGEERTNYPFSINVDDYGNDFGLEAQVLEGSVDPIRILNYFQESLTVLLKEFEKESPCQVKELSILSEDEIKQQLEVFNITEVAYQKNKTIIDLFEEQVEKTPGNIAIIYEGEGLTYKELDDRSNQLARYLLKKGVESEDLVGICIDRSLEMIVGILGILKSGGAYVPMDPEYPQDRIDYLLKDAGIGVFLSSASVITVLEERKELNIILLDEGWELIDKESKAQLERLASPEGLAYVIYTSGSTGRPKGVLTEHRNVISLFNFGDLYDFNDQDVWTMFHSFCFDFSVWELWGALFYGSRLVIVPKNYTKNISLYSKLLSEEGVTVLNQTPSSFYALQEEFFSNPIAHYLRYIIFGGETLTPFYLKKWKAHFPECTLINMYGITETTVHVTYKEITEKELPLSTSPIGSTIPTLSSYIVDESLSLVPIGVAGELCISGAGLARGYLNRENLTKEKFIAHPFMEGERIYKTGDLARWLPDGNLEFIGRKDDQVKIRGYRIELGEIESVLSRQEEVQHCCVLAKESPGGTKRLIGYVVIEGELDKQAIQIALKMQLPEYMVPQLWVALDELPLTSSGKIDKRRLPDPELSDLSSKEYVAPRNETEEQLATIWQDLLSVERVGVYDNFFELGGHSLLIVRLISQLQNTGYVISVKDIFSNPTITSLIEKLSLNSSINTIPANGIVSDCPYITPAMVPLVTLSQEELEHIMDTIPGGAPNIQDIYPLAPLQEGIYFHHLMSDPAQGDPYILPSLVRFRSAIKRSQFIEALQFVINRYDVLRTCFLSTDLTQPVQVVLWEVALSVESMVLATDQEVLPQLEQEVAPENLWMDVSKAPLSQVKVADDLQNDSYYLIINFHHLIMDHVGLEIIIEEIRMYVLGQDDQLLTPTLYRNFIGDIVCNYSSEESEDYFHSLLGGINEPTYPFDLSDILGHGSTRLNLSKVVLPIDLSASIRRMSSRLHISPAVLFHAAFGLVVGQCSNSEYVLFGSLFSGRLLGSEDSASSLGLFINTLPVLLHIQGNVLEYITQTKERLQEMLPYEQTPLPNVHKWSGIPNDMNMFSALLNYRHSKADASSDVHSDKDENIDLGLEVIAGEEHTSYPFTLDIDDFGNDFKLTCRIASDDIDADRIICYMQEALSNLLQFADNEVVLPILELSLLPDTEKKQLLEIFNTTEIAYPKDKTIIDVFEEQVEKTPNNVAVIFEGEELTYQALNDSSNRLAHYLNSTYALGPDYLVGIMLERSLWSIVSILGILKSGGAYVPIDIDYPDDRKSFILDDADLKVLIIESPSLFDVVDYNIPIFSIDVEFEGLPKEDTYLSNPRFDISAQDLAYIIYTSGSTGKPKGVMIEQGSLFNYISYGISNYGSNDCVYDFPLFTSLSFDLTQTSIYMTLLTGGQLHVYKEKEVSEVLKMIVNTESITAIKLTPTHLLFFKDLECSHLLQIIIGGEELFSSHLDCLQDLNPEVSIYNEYGPTEATIGCSVLAVSDYNTKAISIGVPIANTEVYILDDLNNLVPTGVIGELCIGGAGLARGYLNREALTKEKFIEHPFKQGNRIYKTGDLARWLPDGNLEFIGRKDDQVKIRGYRIELGEIESVLSQQEEIQSCCILAKEGPDGTKRLIGYVVVEGELDKQAIQIALKKQLPEYMVPELWVDLAELPLTTNGKVDRKSLPDIEGSDLSSKEYVAPRNEKEQQLASIWQNLLGIEQVGIYDNFFELGGHSLLIVRLSSQLHTIGYTVQVSDIFANPTVASLSTELSLNSSTNLIPANGIVSDCAYITPAMVPLVTLSQEELEHIMDTVPGGAPNIQDIYPLAPLQEGIYFHHLMSDPAQGDPYILPSLVRFRSAMKRSQFIAALQFVINRYDVLRTCFLSTGLVQPVQVVLRDVILSVEDMVLATDQEVLPQLEQKITPENLWMDISKAPLLQAKVADDPQNDSYYLIINFHHLIMDHVGLEFIIEEIRMYASGNEDQLLTPPLYRDFIGDIVCNLSLEESEDYFHSLLGGINEPTYPFDLSDTLGDGSTTLVSSKVVLPLDLSASIRSTSSRLHISPAVLFHAAFGLVVGQCSNKGYALFGSLFSGRLQGSEDSASSLGLFINTLPVLLNIQGNVLEYVIQTKERLQDMLPYEQTPLSSVHQWSGIANDIDMFSALMNYRHSKADIPYDENSGNNEDFLGLEMLAGEERTNYPFVLDVDDFGNDFGLVVQVLEGNIDSADILQYFQESIKELLRELESETPCQVKEISILPEDAIKQQLEIFNATETNYPKDKTILDLFKEQIAKTPYNIAVVYEGEELTYRELDKRSNQLARCLIELGVEPDTLVGICIERSLEMIVGVLGILKSGGAYVPIDPSYPQDRIDYMLEDAVIGFVLCNELTITLFKNNPDLIVLSIKEASINSYASTPLSITLSEESLAYVIYTSGSTGVPKGVMISRSSLFNLLYWYNDYYNLDGSIRVLQITKLVIDIAYQEIFSCLINGGMLCIPNEEYVLDQDYIRDLIGSFKLNFIQLIPDTLSSYLLEGPRLKCLTHVLVGGDHLPVDLGNSIVSKGYSLYNIYGQTESTIDVLANKISMNSTSFMDKVSNTEVYVLNDDQYLQPIGVIGELCIGGSGLAKGYLNRDELTAERFVSNPFRKGERMYKTGDLARWLPDGSIEFIGRKDNQVKIRGYRIELGEIENVLSVQQDVKNCCVLAREGSDDTKRLVGYVVIDGELDKQALQDTLKKQLPEYMVPKLWVQLKELPLTSSGKIDKKGLPDPELSDLSSNTYVAPRNETEQQLATIWQDLLGVERVGVYDNFFELGGHSLLATRLVSMIRKDMNIELLIKNVFEFNTINELTQYIIQNASIELEKTDNLIGRI